MEHIEPSHYKQTQDWYNVISYIVPEAVYVLLLVKYLNVFLSCILVTIQSKWTIKIMENKFWFQLKSKFCSNMENNFWATTSVINRRCQATAISDCFHNHQFVKQLDNLLPIQFSICHIDIVSLRYEHGLLACLASALDGINIIKFIKVYLMTKFV